MANQKVLNFRNSTKELWRDIPKTGGFYQVSSRGRVRSWHNNTNTPGRRGTPIILKQNDSSKHGYPTVCLRNKGDRRTTLVHRIVAEAFLPNPTGKPQVNHIDGDKANNHLSNLEWATRSENQTHAHETGLMNPPKGSDHWSTELTEQDIKSMRREYSKGGVTQKEIAKEYGISRPAVSMIVNHKRWTHV